MQMGCWRELPLWELPWCHVPTAMALADVGTNTCMYFNVGGVRGVGTDIGHLQGTPSTEIHGGGVRGVGTDVGVGTPGT